MDSRLLKLFLKSESFYDEMFPALSEAMHFYKDTEGGQEAVSEVTKEWERAGYKKGLAEGIEKEKVHTEEQRKRAEEEKARAEEEKARADALQAELDRLKESLKKK